MAKPTGEFAAVVVTHPWSCALILQDTVPWQYKHGRPQWQQEESTRSCESRLLVPQSCAKIYALAMYERRSLSVAAAAQPHGTAHKQVLVLIPRFAAAGDS